MVITRLWGGGPPTHLIVRHPWVTCGIADVSDRLTEFEIDDMVAESIRLGENERLGDLLGEYPDWCGEGCEREIDLGSSKIGATKASTGNARPPEPTASFQLKRTHQPRLAPERFLTRTAA